MAVENDSQFIFMIGLTFLSAMLSGSTLEWVYGRGVFEKSWRDPRNLYNIIVLVASFFSALQAFSNFMLYYFQPKATWFLFFCLTQWIFMTHFSVMVVSNRLSMLYRNPAQVWKKLLIINAVMAPISCLVFVSWGGDKLSDSDVYAKMNRIIEPTQIAMWGLIEFVLSGMFIVKMWKFQWTGVERKSMLVLVLVGLCDLSTVFANILVGDLESTVIKAFAYCLRIRLEVNVLCVLVDFLKAKRQPSRRISGLDLTPSNQLQLNKSTMGMYSELTKSTVSRTSKIMGSSSMQAPPSTNFASKLDTFEEPSPVEALEAGTREPEQPWEEESKLEDLEPGTA